MAYFKDLTRYEYSCDRFMCVGELYNIGWLERCAPYATGVLAPELVDKLLALCNSRLTNSWDGTGAISVKKTTSELQTPKGSSTLVMARFASQRQTARSHTSLRA